MAGFRTDIGAYSGATASMPPANSGYNRTTDWPVGGAMAMSTNASTGTTATQWHPTVKWMAGFVIAELIAFHLLSRFLNI